ncbi:hypothetical protein [Hoeflea poritis]|uniref:Uncharacterized protein n=1 Tax=Hoeflea poritis TaxID=2993659 RepID=A0ABT4VTN2_9HYPH|nr:hypothetical protein [Hoeflea poritis]MDA4848071.1 hypothetical protein [Hoeflea poritis]
MNQFFRIKPFYPACLALLLAGAPAAAQENRFVIEPSGDGFVRLDSHTGEISVCSDVEGQIVCRMAADERRALEEEIDLLEERIAVLEQTLAERPGGPESRFPTDEEIDRTFGVMEKLMRRFLGVMEDIEKDNSGRIPGTDAPDRT